MRACWPQILALNKQAANDVSVRSFELEEFLSLHSETSYLGTSSNEYWRFVGQFAIDKHARDFVLELLSVETFVQHFFVLPVLQTFHVANYNYRCKGD